MTARVLHADDALWRPSNQMGVQNTDLGKQLEFDPDGPKALPPDLAAD